MWCPNIFEDTDDVKIGDKHQEHARTYDINGSVSKILVLF
jgi:hypothetical protein